MAYVLNRKSYQAKHEHLFEILLGIIVVINVLFLVIYYLSPSFLVLQ